MSAILSLDELQPVADLIERLQNVQQCMRDLHDEYKEQDFCVQILAKRELRDHVPVANTHALSYFVVLQGLAAMERELIKQMAAHEITVESVLPIAEVA